MIYKAKIIAVHDNGIVTLQLEHSYITFELPARLFYNPQKDQLYRLSFERLVNENP